MRDPTDDELKLEELRGGDSASSSALGELGVAEGAVDGAVDAAVPVVAAPESVDLAVLKLSATEVDDAPSAPSPPNPGDDALEASGKAIESKRAGDAAHPDAARQAQAHAALASLVLPQVCACCGAPSSASRKLDLETRPGALIVPLCERCLTHDAVSRTRSLSVVLAALLIGGATALGLPLMFERLANAGTWQLSVGSWFSRWGLFVLPCGIVAGLFGMRGLGWYAWGRLRRRPGCSRYPALAIRETPREDWVAVLRCARADFAQQLLALNPERVIALSRGVAPRRAPTATPGARWMFAVLLATALLSVASYVIHRPRIQVLNLTEHPLALEVDGEIVARISVTSQESPDAGVVLRLPAGRRHFRALQHAGSPEQQVVAEADLTLQGATRHLYAPAADAYCFWLERIGYGRGNAAAARPGAVERLPLGNPLHFWAFPQPPDVWLAPPPEPLLDDARSSGGEVTALRQARCIDAPKDAQH